MSSCLYLACSYASVHEDQQHPVPKCSLSESEQDLEDQRKTLFGNRLACLDWLIYYLGLSTSTSTCDTSCDSLWKQLMKCL